MARHIERRTAARVAFKSPLRIKNLKSGTFSKARMLNYCDNGVYFESNRALAVGAEIILGIENSPYSNGTAIFDVYRAKILWRKHVQSTFYTYGYGAQLMSDSSDTMRLNADVNRRKHPRWNCNQSVCFFYQNRPHEGVAKNVCTSGLFIETRDALVVGQTIELKIPDRKTHKLKLLTGEIVRSDPRGVGIRVKRMSDKNGENAI